MIRKFRTHILAVILLFLILASAGCTQAPVMADVTPLPPAATTTAAAAVTSTVQPAVIAGDRTATREEMVAFVQEAVAYAKKNGKEKALAEFSRPNGSFFRGVLYIYAYDYNGTTIAHPVNPEKIGVNRLQEPDAEGTWFITNLREAAYNGTGFTTYTYINPVHNNTIEKKLGYGMKVDENWWLGSGIYLGPANVTAACGDSGTIDQNHSFTVRMFRLLNRIPILPQKRRNPHFCLTIILRPLPHDLLPQRPERGIIRMEIERSPHRSDQDATGFRHPHHHAAVELALGRAVAVDRAAEKVPVRAKEAAGCRVLSRKREIGKDRTLVLINLRSERSSG